MKHHVPYVPGFSSLASRGFALLFMLVVGATRLSAQFAYFDVNTDTIAINGGTTVSTAITIESVFILTSAAGGTLYFEERDSQEHKSLGVSATSIGGFAFHPSAATSISASVAVSLNVPHHLAFVQDTVGGTRRLFLDGVLVLQDSSVSSSIFNAGAGPYPTAIGGSYYETSDIFSPGAVGYLDSIRISDVARYTSNFTAPTGDMTADGSTLLLYNFGSGETTATTVTDLSGHGLTGTFGTGFSGATSPTIVATAIPEPSTAAAWIGVVLLGGSLRLKMAAARD